MESSLYERDALRSIFDSQPDGVFVVDQSGTLVLCNRRFCETFGIEPESVAGEKLFEVVRVEGPLTSEEAVVALDSAFKEGKGNLDLKARVRGGELCWFEISFAKSVIAQVECAIGCVRDLGTAGRNVTALLTSEEKFSKIFNYASNAMAVTEVESGKIVDVNPAWVEASGLSRSDVVGRTALSLGIWPDPELRANCVKTLREEGHFEDFEVYFNMRGRLRPFLVSAESVDFGGAPFTLWEFRSIEARKEADEVLRQSEEKYRALVETADDLIWSVDEAGNWTFVNSRGALSIYGMEPEEMLGRYSGDWNIDPDRTSVRAIYAQLWQGKSVFGHETRHRTKDGGIVDLSFNAIPKLDSQGKFLGASGTARNITKRRAAEKSLFDIAQRLALAQQAAKIGVWEWDEISQELIWDRSNFLLFGVEPTSQSDPFKVWEAAVHPADFQRTADELAEAISTGHDLHNAFRIIQEDGEVRHLEAHASMIRGASGKVERVIGVNIDISDRFRLEEQLRMSQKMEAVGQLAGGVAHDFNNLLSVIIGFTDIVLTDMPSDCEFRSDLEQVLRAANRASSLTKQLLAFSRRSMMEMKLLNLNAVLADSESLLRRVIGENIVFETEYDDSIPMVKADPNQLEQVLMNLAVNARDAMVDGGRLNIKTERVVLDRPLRTENLQPGVYAAVVVSDSGVGMSSEILERIFEPFFTTKEKGKGTGLGLSVAHGIVRQSGGEIRVQSQLGAGAVFKVILPEAHADVAKVIPDKLRVESSFEGSVSPVGAARILIVEDERAVSAVAERTLISAGFRVLTASNGAEALEVLLGQSEPVDLVLADVVMPVMTGPQLAEAVATVRPNLKFLFMSGYTADAMDRHGIDETSQKILYKPFTASLLVEAVRFALAD